MKTVIVLFLFLAFNGSAYAENKAASVKDITEIYCIDVPYGNNNSSFQEINKVAKEKISSMRTEGLVPLASEGPTITTREDTSQICMRAIAISPQPIDY